MFFDRAYHFHLQIWTENHMPIGKSEIVLKVQKCIPSRDGIHPDKKKLSTETLVR